ncbi:hypothetical protein U6A24_11030 [Aquimarina gracilis]|uniref:Uncharacterized protein n=1 Tax=Aquimarina gracilis TaxID=874422 RepID=A0ABU5ZVW4_9FLAO|nr:hypothetical protein [Aquimarina gracilis]MEB3345998.1 hypothetical protein [Aquimarina gracilis]
MFANFAGIQALSASTGIEVKGALVGLGLGKLNKSAYSNNNALVGVFGRAHNAASDPAPAYGGYFIGLKANGFFYNVKVITQTTTSHTVSGSEDYISCYNTELLQLYLPTSNRHPGRIIYVKRINGLVRVYGNGVNLMLHNQGSSVEVADGDCWMFVFDGSYWCAQKLIR